MPSREELLRHVKITVEVESTHMTYQRKFYDLEDMEVYVRRVVRKYKKKNKIISLK